MTTLWQRLLNGRRFLIAPVAIAIGVCAPLAGQQAKSPEASNTDLIRPGEWLRIQVVGTLPDAPIEDLHQVEASGKVALGPHYGRVHINGMTLEDAEVKVTAYLAKSLAAPKLQITRYEAPPRPVRSVDQVLERCVDRLELQVERLQMAVQKLSK